MSKSSRANTQMHDFNEGMRTKIYNLIHDTNFSHPAIVQCCLDIGLYPEELKPKDLTEFIDKGISHELPQVRWNHYEIKRKAKLEAVINELIIRRAHLKPTPRLSEASISKDYTPNNAFLTPVDLWNRRKHIEATRLQYVMKVQDNLEQLELDHEKKRFEAQRKIQAKIEKAEKDRAELTKKKQGKLKQKDVKIKQIREQKRRVRSYVGT